MKNFLNLQEEIKEEIIKIVNKENNIYYYAIEEDYYQLIIKVTNEMNSYNEVFSRSISKLNQELFCEIFKNPKIIVPFVNIFTQRPFFDEEEELLKDKISNAKYVNIDHTRIKLGTIISPINIEEEFKSFKEEAISILEITRKIESIRRASIKTTLRLMFNKERELVNNLVRAYDLDLEEQFVNHIDDLKNSLKERLDDEYYVNEFIEITLIKYTSLVKKQLF